MNLGATGVGKPWGQRKEAQVPHEWVNPGPWARRSPGFVFAFVMCAGEREREAAS